MARDITVENICDVISDALRVSNNAEQLSAPITIDSEMNQPKEWDSLSFVVVFNAIGAEFGIELEDDDAICFMSVRGIHEFLVECTS